MLPSSIIPNQQQQQQQGGGGGGGGLQILQGFGANSAFSGGGAGLQVRGKEATWKW